MKNEITKTPTNQQFIEAFEHIVGETIKCCQMLASMVNVNPNVYDELIALDSRLNYNMLESMRRVGTGQMYEKLLFDPSMGARKLLGLPPALQKKLYNEGIQVVKIIDGKNIVELKPIGKMSSHELSLVIDSEKNRARTVEEQIAFIKPPAPAKRAERYQILHNGEILKVMPETEITREQLRVILGRMDSQALAALPETIQKNQLAKK